MTDECPRCNNPFTADEQSKGYQVCHSCYRADPTWWQGHIEIQKHMRYELGGLRKMVSLSRKGKIRKQPSGFHIVTL